LSPLFVASELGDCVLERVAVEVLDEGDYVTADSAPAVENLLADINAETVAAAAYWAWAYSLSATFSKFDAAPRDFVLDPYKARALDEGVQGGRVGRRAHAAPRTLSAGSADEASLVLSLH
jgi:hypothetical protein